MKRILAIAALLLSLGFVAVVAAQTPPASDPSSGQGTPPTGFLCATPVAESSATPVKIVDAATTAAEPGGVAPGTPVGLYPCNGTPAADGGQANTAPTVEMVDIAFKEKEFTIPANTDVTVTLINNGAAMHNFSITDHNNPNVANLGISVDVQPGQTATVTINAAAGDYYFYCNVPGHEAAGMFGTMHVQ